MKFNSPLIKLFLIGISVFAFSFYQPKAPSGSSLGNLYFPISGKPKAQKAFQKGLLLMHSFEYKDALEAFEEAQKEDPECVMAYWGEAMAHNHPIWQ